MDLGLIGQQGSGKTTVFNAVTRGHASAGSFGGLEPSIGVVKQPDERLDRLCDLIKPKKVTFTEVRYLDFPGGLTVRDQSPSAAHLAALSQCDALVLIARAFRDDPTAEESFDGDSQIGEINLELAFADAAMLERRAQKLDISVRSARPGERDADEREQTLIQRLREALDRGEPLRAQPLTADERRTISGYQLLTNKPLVIMLNIDEGDIGRIDEIEAELTERWGGPGVQVGALCGKLEKELAELSDEEAAEFRADLGLETDGTARLLHLSQQALGLLTFYTVGEPEGRAWATPAGSTALDVAAKIHTDIARGFIRCETVGWQELLDCGSYAEARKRGQLRTEGKQYEVQDGDVLHILFNV